MNTGGSLYASPHRYFDKNPQSVQRLASGESGQDRDAGERTGDLVDEALEQIRDGGVHD